MKLSKEEKVEGKNLLLITTGTFIIVGYGLAQLTGITGLITSAVAIGGLSYVLYKSNIYAVREEAKDEKWVELPSDHEEFI